MNNTFLAKINGATVGFLLWIPILLVALMPLSFAMAVTSVSTYPVSSISRTSAVLNGYVASGSGFSDVWFEFGKASGGLDKKTQQITVSNNRPFKISLTNLEEGTRYYYRAIAVNKDGISTGSTDTFITTGNPVGTPSSTIGSGTTFGSTFNNNQFGINRNSYPFVITNFPENVTDTSAKLKGQAINSSNLPTVVWFEWGIDKDFLTLKTPERNVGDTPLENFEDTISGLQPNTFYYYRAVIRNQIGESRGDMIRMKTLPSPLATVPTVTTPAPTSARPAQPDTTPKKDASVSDDQTASVSDEQNFFPNTLVGWLTIIALLILIIVLADHMYGERQKRKEELKKLEVVKTE